MAHRQAIRAISERQNPSGPKWIELERQHSSALFHFQSVGGENLGEPLGRALGCALQGVVVHVDESKSLGVAVGPL